MFKKLKENMLKSLNIDFLERYLLHLNVLLFILIIPFCHSAIDINSEGYSLHTELTENFIQNNNNNSNNNNNTTIPSITPSNNNNYHQNTDKLNELETALKTINNNQTRDRRQILYNSQWYYVTNLSTEGGLCRLPNGLEGVCIASEKCSSYSTNQQMQQIHDQNSQQQQERQIPSHLCIYFDKFLRSNLGLCCIDHQQTQNQSNENRNTFTRLHPTDGNSITILDSDPNSPIRNKEGQQNSTFHKKHQETDTIYHPVKEEDVIKGVPSNGSNVRYPWPEFIDYNNPQLWPPSIPMQPANYPIWPMPLPTFPPQQYFPSLPIGGIQPTTYRPIYPQYPQYPQYPLYPQYPQHPFYPQYPGFSTHRPPLAGTSATFITSGPAVTITSTRRPPVSGPNQPPINNLPMTCGIRTVISPDQERIVGGSNASPFEFPWIVVLFKGGKQFCGGSLITNNHILTAAHCVARMTSWDVASITAHLGDYNIRTDFEVQHVTRRIRRLVRHKGFDFIRLHNDIAILTLNKPVAFDYQVQPICLPTSPSLRERSFSGKLATVAGWGSLRENGLQPAILQKVQVPIWSNGECARRYGFAAPGGITSSMICAGQAAKDSCSGDSGGPMVVNEGGRFIQVGIVSWGIGCGKGQYPGVYTRITTLLPWIYKNIK